MDDPRPTLSASREGGLQLYDLSTESETLLTEPSLWAEGVFFFEENVKVSFDVLIDTNGKTYFKNKSAWEAKIKKKRQVVAGYLGNKNDKGLTIEAQQALNELKQQIGVKKAAIKKQVQILSTPTDTLNVRNGPGTSYNIVAKVNPGEKYQLLEEKGDWYKIKLPSKTGWISSQYAKRL